MFFYSNVAESSIALRSSMRTGDHRVIFSIDGSDHRFGGEIEWSLASKDSKHGCCLDSWRTGRRSWSCFGLKMGSATTRGRQYQTPSFGCSAKAGKPSDVLADVRSGMISKRQLSKGTFGSEMN